MDARTITVDCRSLSAAKCSGEAARLPLHCVAIRPNGTVLATDGRKFVAIRAGATDGAPLDLSGDSADSILVPAEFPAPVLRGLSAKDRRAGSMVDVTLNGRLSVSSARANVKAERAPVEGRFPPMEQTIPKATETAFRVSVKHLSDVLEAAKGAGVEFLSFHLPTATAPNASLAHVRMEDGLGTFLAVLAQVTGGQRATS